MSASLAWKKRPFSMGIATFFGVGMLPIAPGTWGTIACLPALVWISSMGPLVRAAAVLVVCVIGAWTAQRVGEVMGEHDSGHIVIDEVAGIAIATMLFGQLTLVSWIVAFISFRLFDITKPQPIRRIDQSWNNGLGVMADDMLAGAYCVPFVALSQWLSV